MFPNVVWPTMGTDVGAGAGRDGGVGSAEEPVAWQ